MRVVRSVQLILQSDAVPSLSPFCLFFLSFSCVCFPCGLFRRFARSLLLSSLANGPDRIAWVFRNTNTHGGRRSVPEQTPFGDQPSLRWWNCHS